MQGSVDSQGPCSHDGIDGCVNHILVNDNHAKSSTSWRSGGVGHFNKDFLANSGC